MKYFYLACFLSLFSLNAIAMQDDSLAEPKATIKPPLSSRTSIKPEELTQEEQTLKKEIQITSQSGIINAWVSLFEQQEIQLSRAQNDPAYCPMKMTDGREIKLPVYVLPADHTLLIAAVGLSSSDVDDLDQLSDSRISIQSTLFWKTRFLNAASVIKKRLGFYAAANDLQLNMAFIIEPHKNSIIASAPKDILSPTKDYKSALKFAIERIKFLSKHEDIIKDTREGSYNEVTLLGPPLFNKLFPEHGPSFTVKGIFVTLDALRRYQHVPSIESHKLLEGFLNWQKKTFPFIYLLRHLVNERQKNI